MFVNNQALFGNVREYSKVLFINQKIGHVNSSEFQIMKLERKRDLSFLKLDKRLSDRVYKKARFFSPFRSSVLHTLSFIQTVCVVSLRHLKNWCVSGF